MPLALLLALALTPQLGSTQVVALSFDQLAAGTQVAVWGKVASVQSSRRADNPKVFETLVTITPLARHARTPQAPQGEGANAVSSFVVQGGWVGRFAQMVPGAPRFQQGEEIVVLLEEMAGGRMGIVGFNQGLWRVQRTESGAQATSDRAGVELVSPVQGGTVAPQSYTDGRPLDALWSALGAAIASTPAPGAGGAPAREAQP